MTAFVRKLSLINYRNFDQFTLDINSRYVVISGNNGAGKTNILEALSFLSPGRGLRYADIDDLCKKPHHLGKNTEAHFLLKSAMGPVDIRMNIDSVKSKKTIEFNGKKIKNSELTNFIGAIWLTPQMDGVFYGPSAERRKLIDRASFIFFKNHASLLSNYEYLKLERIKILESGINHHTWLSSIEDKIATISVEIHCNRISTIDVIQKEINNLDNLFPKAILTLEPVYDRFDYEFVMQQLERSRSKDKMTLRSNFGIHRSDLVVYYDGKNVLAKNCSTGEQKAMLVSMTIAQVMAQSCFSNASPMIVLLDETFVHLDKARQEHLVRLLDIHNAQIWITSADDNVGEYFSEAQIVKL